MIVAYGPRDDNTRHRLWLAMRLGLGADAFLNTCGSVANEDEDGNILACVVYTGYETFRETGEAQCWASIAGLPKTRWCTRKFVKAILSYPFEHLGVGVLRTMCAKSNMDARRFNEHLGLRFIGKGRKGWDGKQAAFYYDMLPHEATKWLGYEPKRIEDDGRQERRRKLS